MNIKQCAIARSWYFALLLCCAVAPALADVPLAGRDADRQAKSAAPSASESFIYVYRGDDTDSTPIAVTLIGRDTARLAPRTFGFWKVKPGRAEFSVERSASTLPVQTDGGRVYYIELARGASGVAALRTVSFATGRVQVYRSQLVAQAKEPNRTEPTRTTSSAPAHYSEATTGAIMVKFGSFKLATETQTIVGTNRKYDTSASPLGIEGEWFLRPDISLGGELMRYSNDYSTPGATGTGTTDTTVGLFNIKRYFLPDSNWQPYLGAGLGFATTASSIKSGSGFQGDTSAYALQLTGGLQWRSGRFGLRGEYKYLHAKTKADNNESIDVSGSGIFLGAGFFF